jgi:hypothetical protein
MNSDLKIKNSCEIMVNASSDGRYLAILDYVRFSKSILIFDMKTFKFISILIQLDSIGDFNWNLNDPYLSVLTGNNYVYMWAPDGAIAIPYPTEIDLNGFIESSWGINERILIKCQNSKFCICSADFICEN